MNEYLVCPKCKKEDSLSYAMLERDWNEAYCIIECTCGFSFREIFHFHHNETADETGRLLNDNGNIVDLEHDEEMLKEQLKEMRPNCVGGGLYD